MRRSHTKATSYALTHVLTTGYVFCKLVPAPPPPRSALRSLARPQVQDTMAGINRAFTCMLLVGLLATAISCEAASAGNVMAFALHERLHVARLA